MLDASACKGMLLRHGAGKVKEGWLLPRCSFPAGAICCSVLDLLQYGRYITHPKACDNPEQSDLIELVM